LHVRSLGRNGKVLSRSGLALSFKCIRNMFSSEKVLQMSYANYQRVSALYFVTFLTICRRGKEALVEKFKNSCIMNEREGWRPKIFVRQSQIDPLIDNPLHSFLLEKCKVYQNLSLHLHI
jgi:hypothetical protein